MHRYANPLRYQRVADAVLPWAGALAVALTIAGLYLALVVAPPDYQQGEAYRIMYVHVPAAWMALMIYAMMAGASVVLQEAVPVLLGAVACGAPAEEDYGVGPVRDLLVCPEP